VLKMKEKMRRQLRLQNLNHSEFQSWYCANPISQKRPPSFPPRPLILINHAEVLSPLIMFDSSYSFSYFIVASNLSSSSKPTCEAPRTPYKVNYCYQYFPTVRGLQQFLLSSSLLLSFLQFLDLNLSRST
jgi:hypothetical protein